MENIGEKVEEIPSDDKFYDLSTNLKMDFLV